MARSHLVCTSSISEETQLSRMRRAHRRAVEPALGGTTVTLPALQQFLAAGLPPVHLAEREI